jgi:hypothetical protein
VISVASGWFQNQTEVHAMKKPTVVQLRRSKPPKTPDFKPLFTHQQVHEFEAEHGESLSEDRRLTMFTLASPAASLLERFSDKTALACLIDRISDYRDHLQSSIILAESAVSRLQTVGAFIAATAEGVTA